MKKHALLVIIALLSRIGQAACEISIAVNQVGYLPEAPKWCRCEQPPAKDYAIFMIGTDIVWRTAALRTADRIKAKLVRQAMLPGDLKSGGSAQAAGSWSLYLNECAELFGRRIA